MLSIWGYLGLALVPIVLLFWIIVRFKKPELLGYDKDQPIAMGRKRDASVMLLGLMMCVAGLLGFIIRIHWMSTSTSHPFRIYDLLIQILVFGLGVGFLLLKEWARRFTAYFFLIGAIWSGMTLVLDVFNKDFDSNKLIVTIIGIAISLAIWHYLTRPKVKEKFK